MKKAILVLLVVLFSSCKKEDSNEELTIRYKDFNVYLKAPKGSDALSPPIFFLNFSIKNLSTDEKFFACKSSLYGDDKSIMYILDTLQGKIIPLYSKDFNSIQPKDSIKITGEIEVQKFKEYFGLSDEFLHKFDFESDKEKLEKLCSDMLNRSIIIYVPDSTDLGSYRVENKNITSLRYNSIIKVIK
jgi:hypothetical protein